MPEPQTMQAPQGSVRRSFIRSLAGAVVAIALAPRAGMASKTPLHLVTADPSSFGPLIDLEISDVVPPPVPSGFVLRRAASHDLLGFPATNGRQAVYEFVRPTAATFHEALRVYVAHQPAGHFWQSRNRAPEAFPAVGATGRRIRIEYFDGYWAPKHIARTYPVEPDGWQRNYVHSVVVRTELVAAAALAHRSLGIRREDLCAIVSRMF